MIMRVRIFRNQWRGMISYRCISLSTRIWQICHASCKSRRPFFRRINTILWNYNSMNKHESAEEFLKIRELAKWIRLSESHLYCLVSKRKIPFIKLGGKLLFSTVQIRNWINQSSYVPVVTKQPARRGRPRKATPSGGIISIQTPVIAPKRQCESQINYWWFLWGSQLLLMDYPKYHRPAPPR